MSIRLKLAAALALAGAAAIAAAAGVFVTLQRRSLQASEEEKIHLLLDERDPVPSGAHVEDGRIDEVVYLGMVTRYVVELDGGGRLVAVRQNLETAAEEALDARGRRIRVAWRPEQSYEIAANKEEP